MAKKKKMYKLEDIIPLLSEDSLKVAGGMIQDTIFMGNMLEKLRQQIAEEGVSEDYQYGSKQTAAMTSYLQIQKQYGVNIKFLSSLMNLKGNPAGSAIDEWLENN